MIGQSFAQRLEAKQAMRQSTEQRMTHAQRMSQRMHIAQQLATQIYANFLDGPDAPQKSYEKVVDEVTANEEPAQIREGVRTVMKNRAVKSAVLTHPLILANQNIGKLNIVIAKALFDVSNGGHFDFETRRDARTIEGELYRALEDPAGYAKAIEEFTAVGGHAALNAMEQLREKENARDAVEACRDFIENVRNSILLLLSLKPDGNERAFLNYMRDIIAFDCFAPMVSARIQNRFVTSATTINRGDKPERLRYGTLNTVGEFTLASMGVIAPDLFTTQAGEVDQQAYDAAKSMFERNNMDIDRELSRHHLTAPGTFYFNRYQTLDRRPNRVTEKLVRQFITETVRESGDEVLDALEFETGLFPRIKQSLFDDHDKTVHGRQNAITEIHEHLGTALGGMRFRDFIREKISRDWYDKLQIFMPAA